MSPFRASSSTPTSIRTTSSRRRRWPAQIADARIVIYNGADYDPWMDKLLAASPAAERKVDRRRRADRPEGGRQSASLVRPGDDAGARRRAGRGLVRRSIRQTPRAMRSAAAPIPPALAPVTAKIAEIKAPLRRRSGDRDRAGLRLHGGGARPQDAQRATSSSPIMNETEPSASETAAIEGRSQEPSGQDASSTTRRSPTP